MEEELIAQRDAAIAVAKELQKQLQDEHEYMEEKLERRALTAERLRLQAVEELRALKEDRLWESTMNQRLLWFSVVGGIVGATAGWGLGLIALAITGQPVIGFLLILPCMALMNVLGLAVAKTRIEVENRRRVLTHSLATRLKEVEQNMSNGTEQEFDMDTIEVNAIGQDIVNSALSFVSNSTDFLWRSICASKDILFAISSAEYPHNANFSPPPIKSKVT